jgi:threonylcarbamoyladenosine tRNA methylthiotransferase MtaB
MPHFHVSIQSFSDNVLSAMRRNYTAKILKEVLTKFRALKLGVPVSLWADIIVGFPWETEKDFQKTLEGIKKFGINKVHAFPFSDHHTGTTIPASSLPNQADPMTKRRRDKEIKKIADDIAQQFYQANKWISHAVLVEGNQSGWTENYIKVDVTGKGKKGDIIKIIL